MTAVDKNGSLVFSQAAGQSMLKSGGSLTVGTSDANLLVLKANGSNYWQLETAANAWEAMERVQSGVTPDLLSLRVRVDIAVVPGVGDVLLGRRGVGIPDDAVNEKVHWHSV